MMRLICLSLPTLATLVGVVTTAGAADTDAPPSFPKGTVAADIAFNYVVGFDKDNTSIFGPEIGVRKFVFDDIAVGISAAAHLAASDEDDVFAGSLSATGRHHLIDWQSGTFFIDGSVGVFEGADDIPSDGTRFNFMSRAGIGVTLRLNERLHFVGGGRYWHLSNAQFEGASKNPKIDGIELHTGLLWAW